MRVLLLVLQYPPDVNSTGMLMEQVARGLVEEGHDVTVFTAFPHYERFRVLEEYRGRLFEWDARHGVRILRLPVHASGHKDRMLHRLWSYLSFNGAAAIAGLLTRRRFDVILATNGSFFSGITAWWIGRAKGIPFVLNVQDLYPAVPVQAGQLRNPAAIAILTRLERFMYRKAAHLTVITDSFREHLTSMGIRNGRVSVVPNFVDVGFVRPLPRDNHFSLHHGLDGRFVVSHAGNLGYAYGLETVVDAAALLKDRPEIVFLIVGDGVAKANLEETVRARELGNVRFLPYQPLEDLPWVRASSDVQLALYARGAGRHSMPCKIYEIMASGRPMLASADEGTDLHRIVEEAGCGVWVEPGNPRALADAVLALHADPERRRAMSEAGRSLAVERYAREVVVQRYVDLLHRIGKGTPPARPHLRKDRSAA